MELLELQDGKSILTAIAVIAIDEFNITFPIDRNIACGRLLLLFRRAGQTAAIAKPTAIENRFSNHFHQHHSFHLRLRVHTISVPGAYLR
jgi:hypothetical protein